MAARTPRSAWLTAFLWINFIAWGIALGGKLFEFVVVIPAWAASPPGSLSLMPYGPRYPLNPNDFYQPLGAIALVGCVGSLICGWRTPGRYKVFLWIPFAVFLIVAAVTPTLFWPMIRDLYRAGTGAAPLTESAAHALVQKWLWYDAIRTSLELPVLISIAQALSKKDRAHLMDNEGNRQERGSTTTPSNDMGGLMSVESRGQGKSRDCKKPPMVQV